jgi:hypothetical protein
VRQGPDRDQARPLGDVQLGPAKRLPRLLLLVGAR